MTNPPSEEINSDVLFDLAQLKEAVEYDRLIWPWSQAHKDALVLAAQFVIDHADPPKEEAENE